MIPSEPGLYPNLSRPVYDAINHVNFSRLRHYEQSPAHYREAMLHPKAPSAAMVRGQVVHTAVLEPHVFEDRYVAAPEVDRRFKEGKAAWAAFEAEHPTQELVEAELFDWCLGMRDAVWAHPQAREMLGGAGSSEVAALWRDEPSGFACKALIDRIGQVVDSTFVVDLKTVRDARAWSFSASIARYEYHAQAAFYLDGLLALSPYPRRWVWIVVEEQPPHGVIPFEPDYQCLEIGRERYRGWLTAHARCTEANHWPGYGTEIQPIALPRWATKGESNGLGFGED